MERNVMGELNVYRGSGAKPNFSEIARRHGMDDRVENVGVRVTP